jgi:hypothetical protein
MYTKVLTAVLCAAVVLAFSLSASGQEKEDKTGTKAKKVTVKGVAGGEDAGARDKAVMDAMRKAVEQGVGTFIQSQTEVENYEVIYDKIISNTEGYIDEYKVVKEGIDNPGTRKAMTWVIIEAVVKLGELKDDWKQLAFLIKKKGNPKIMVVVRDKVDNKLKKTDTDRATVEIESFFVGKGLSVVDKATIEQNKLNDIKVASLEGNLAKVAALGKECRAHLVVIGYVEAAFEKTTSPYGAGTWYYYKGSMVAKVISTEDGKVVFPFSFPSGKNTKANDQSKVEAANKVLSKVAKAGAPKILTGIMKAWNKDIIVGYEITMTVQNISYGALRRMIKKIEKIRFVSEVVRDHYSNKIAKLRVKTRLDGSELADELLDREICNEFQVTGATKSTIEVDMSKKEDE